MDYERLLKTAPPAFNVPMRWELPGGGMGGLTLCCGGALRLGTQVRALTEKPVLLVIGPAVNRLETGVLIRRLLTEAKIPFDTFSKIAGEPDEDTLRELLQTMEGREYGAVVGVGGGSALDVAKLAAHATEGRTAFWDKLQEKAFPAPGLPTVLLPTTAGSGSEASPYVVLTIAGRKVFFTSRALLAVASIVDPLLTVTMPPSLTAATALDALTHGIEGTMAWPSPYTFAMAEESTALIARYLEPAMERGDDLEARYHLALASVMGMLAYSMGGGLYAHSISYLLTLRKGLPHGVGCGLALPFTMAYSRDEIAPFLDRLARKLPSGPGGDQTRVIDRIRGLYLAARLPASLREIGFSEKDLDKLVDELLGSYHREKNPRKMTRPDARRLLEAMLSGEITYF